MESMDFAEARVSKPWHSYELAMYNLNATGTDNVEDGNVFLDLFCATLDAPSQN